MGLFSGITSALSGITGAVGSIIDPISGLISGGASLLGGMATNDANADLAQQQNAFSAQQYATRYQTSVKDMEAAGLNPMLAYSQSPGSAPTGNAIAMQNPVTPAVNSALETMQTRAAVSKQNADTDLSRALSIKAAADTTQSLASAKAATAQAGLTTASTPVKQVESDIAGAIHKIIAPVTSSAGQLRDQNAPSPFHKLIDKIGAWNPYGLPN